MSKNKIRNNGIGKQEEKSMQMKKNSSKSNKKRFQIPTRIGTVLFGAGFLEDKKNAPVLRYIFFLCLIFMLYIFYGYRSEKQIREANKLEKEVNELRSEFIFTTGELMFLKKQSNLSGQVKKIGLKASTNPPYIIKTSVQNIETE